MSADSLFWEMPIKWFDQSVLQTLHNMAFL